MEDGKWKMDDGDYRVEFRFKCKFKSKIHSIILSFYILKKELNENF